MALPTVQLTGTIVAPDAQAKRSGLTIRLAAPLVDAADKILVAADSLNVRLDGYGKFALPLVPSDAAGLAPSPVPYVITEQWGDRRSYNVFIPSGVGTVDLANLVPVANPPVIPNLLGVEASNREAADAALDAAKVNRAGDSMTGDLAMAGHRVTGLADPVGGQDAATKAHVAAEVTSSAAAAVAALVNAAPSTLDTLGELAAALQTDESAAAALTTSVGQKLNVIVHGSTAGTARTTGAPAVLWIGTVAPTNAATNDVWFDKTAVLFKLWTGTVWSASGSGTFVPFIGAASYTYNADGTVATATEGGIVTTYTYNADGSVNTVNRSGVTLTYSYNADGTVAGVA